MAKTGVETITTKWPKIFLFGDSITQFSLSNEGCWGCLIGDFFQRRCDVVVRGFSGYNTRQCKFVLPKVLDAQVAKEVVAITIFLGVNDQVDVKVNPQQAVPLEEYTANLHALVDHCLSVGISRDKIILISPPPFDAIAWGEVCKTRGTVLSRDIATTTKFAAACCQVAKDVGANGIDLFSEMMKDEDHTKYLSDGLHLSEKGSCVLFELLKPVLEKLTSHIPPLLFPDWKDIDNANPEPSFKDW